MNAGVQLRNNGDFSRCAVSIHFQSSTQYAQQCCAAATNGREVKRQH